MSYDNYLDNYPDYADGLPGAYDYGDTYNGGNDTTIFNDTTNGTNGTTGYDDDYNYEDYFDYIDGGGIFQTVYHKVYPFEEYIYLYLWPGLVILTTIANILVILVLRRKSMRTSTNIILIAIAMSDSMTGFVTLPAYMHAYSLRAASHLVLTQFWCEYFMLTKLFLTRAFHTMSVWLTLVLGFQRLISVSSPFKAQSMFSISKTLVMIVVVVICSPLLHIYQLTEEKTVGMDCKWELKEPCESGCIYIWVTFYLAHFIPCVLLIAFTVTMVIKLRKAAEKMSNANMISNEANMRRRNAENRRISVIVIVIVVFFLIPEIPYAFYLLLNVSLKHARKDLLHMRSNRVFMCTYELLMILSFHANFWVYTIMNQKFRHGLSSLFSPCTSVVYSVLAALGVKTTADKNKRRQSVSSAIRTFHSDVPFSHKEPTSDEITSNCKAHEMKVYTFDEDGRNVPASGITSG